MATGPQSWSAMSFSRLRSWHACSNCSLETEPGSRPQAYPRHDSGSGDEAFLRKPKSYFRLVAAAEQNANRTSSWPYGAFCERSTVRSCSALATASRVTIKFSSTRRNEGLPSAANNAQHQALSSPSQAALGVNFDLLSKQAVGSGVVSARVRAASCASIRARVVPRSARATTPDPTARTRPSASSRTLPQATSRPPTQATSSRTPRVAR